MRHLRHPAARSGPIGRNLVDMCQAMRHRGYDSTGFALYGEHDPRRLIAAPAAARRRRRRSATLDALEGSLRERGVDARRRARDRRRARRARPLRARARDAGRRPRCGRSCARSTTPAGIEIQSIGHSLEIVKDLGDAETVNARHGIDRFVGTHGLGHVRLTTESIVDVAYGHPFWAEPFPDVSIVHNGQLTNYYRFRRILQQEGYRFHTTNDSELIAVYLADRMEHGQHALGRAQDQRLRARRLLRVPLRDARTRIGSAKDMFAIKSLVVANVDGDVRDGHRGAGAARASSTGELDDRPARAASVYVWEAGGARATEIV